MPTLPRLLLAAALLPAVAAWCEEPVALDTPAQAYVRKLPAGKPADKAQKNLSPSPTDSVMQPKRRGTKIEVKNDETTQRIEEIRVYSYRDPADYITPEKPPLLQMRDQLSSAHRLTLAERLKSWACLFPPCWEAPGEMPVEDRKDGRLQRTTLELGLDQAGRGPLQ